MAASPSDDRYIVVEGLDELRKDLRAFGSAATRELSKASKAMSEEIATKATARAQMLGGVAGHIVDGIKAVGRGNAVYVRLDGIAQPAIFGAEFGSDRYHQFKPWRGNSSDAGYFLYPTIRELQDSDIAHRYGQIVEDLLTKHGGN